VKKFFLLITIYLVSFFIISCPPAKASAEFETRSRIIYQLGSRGSAEVEQKVSLTNNFSNIYPKEYQLRIEKGEIENIGANDNLGDIVKKITKNPQLTEIQLSFNQPVVGKGEKLDFEIHYSLPNFAVKKGQVWEITVPGIDDLEGVEELTLTIKVPPSFGELAYSSKPITGSETEAGWQSISYDKKQLSSQPLILAFGEFQIFNFDLKFFLENSKDQSQITEIPIPPDTAYQSIILTELTPEPETIVLDSDFNWLARYYLSPKEKKNIRAKGQAKIFPQPENLPFINASKTNDPSLYLKADTYWEIDNPTIHELAQKVNKPKAIQELIISRMNYELGDLSSIKRIGAVEAYRLGKGVCTEFSDLFVALARASGIPAREIEGFAFTENQKLVSLAVDNDVLHSWAEYWDSQKSNWVPTDPTWAETTNGIDFAQGFDLGHFAFVIHGMDSDYPYPPGFYKTDQNQKNISVEFANQLIPQPETKLIPVLVKSGNNILLKIKNNSLAANYQTKVEIKTPKEDQREVTINVLPPFGEEKIAIEKPNIFQIIFTKPQLEVIINQDYFSLDYPDFKLNFLSFFANLFKK